MSEENQLWMIRDGAGRIIGPYNTEKVLDLIRELILTGDEFIALYPSGDWIPITKRPEFYDLLLEAISRTQQQAPMFSTTAQKIEQAEPVSVEVRRDEPIGVETDKTEMVSDFANIEVDQEIKAESAPNPEDLRKAEAKKDKKKKKIQQIIELTNIKAHIKKSKRKKSFAPLFIATIVFVAAVYVLLTPTAAKDKLRLIKPQKGRAAISAAEGKKRFEIALADFSRDTLDSYRKAMNNLVQIAEGMPKTPGAYQMLCMTYRELWPFAYQDQIDSAVIDEVTKMVENIDPSGKFSATCRAVKFLLSGKLAESRATVENLLEAGATDAIFFELKGSILGGSVEAIVEGDYVNGLVYMDKAIQYWPQWMKPRVASAVYLWRQGDIGQALQRLKQVLDANPGHDVARALYGIIHLRSLAKPDIALSQLLPLANSKQIPRILLSDANFALADIYSARGEGQKAGKFAKVSYQLNPSNLKARELMLKYGSGKGDEKPSLLAGALYVSDQFFSKGNYLAAAAEYKAAFEANPKNGLAAMKAAKALWKVGQTQDAMDWLDKAIKANPTLVEPYVTKAEYYTEKYDYFAAATMLKKAQGLNKSSFEIYRGMALVELKRGNAQGAISYAETSLKLNPADVNSHVIIAKAYLQLQNTSEAYKYAGRALELENSAYETQDIYARTLVQIQGIDMAYNHVRNLIQTFPAVVSYRIILADLYFQDERFADAAAVYKQITMVDPQMKEGFWGLGKSLQAQGKFKEAIDPLLKAASLDPSDANSWFLLAQLYSAAGQYQKAISAFETVINRNPLFPLAHLMLGRVAMQVGNLDLALSEALKEQSNNPLGPDAFLLAAEVYSQQQRYTQCTNEIQKALKLGTLGAKIYVIMARCYRLSGSIDTALSMIRIAEQRESGLPDVYLELGLVYEAKGDPTSAAEAYNQYLTLVPNAKDAAQIRQKINQLGH
jgi:tetratricopeptide (TPR) repeat protein